MSEPIKPRLFVQSSRKDLLGFPDEVVRLVGFALHLAQVGERHPQSKVLKGFAGAGVLEVVEDFDGNAYRAVYTVKFEGTVYVLHAFQKKSKRGIETPKHEIELVRQRLMQAQKIHLTRLKEKLH